MHICFRYTVTWKFC